MRELWTEDAGKGGELLIGFRQNTTLVAVKNNIQITGFKNLCTIKFLTQQLQKTLLCFWYKNITKFFV